MTRLARERGAEALPVASKVRTASDVRQVERALGEPVVAAVPADEAVLEAERFGLAVIDYEPGSSAVEAVERLAALLCRGGEVE